MSPVINALTLSLCCLCPLLLPEVSGKQYSSNVISFLWTFWKEELELHTNMFFPGKFNIAVTTSLLIKLHFPQVLLHFYFSCTLRD